MKYIVILVAFNLALFAGSNSVRTTKGVIITLNDKLICFHSKYTGMFLLNNEAVNAGAKDIMFVSNQNLFSIESGYIVDYDHRAYLPSNCKIIK